MMGVAEPSSVGVIGMGAYLPEEVRTNDWWPKERVERWIEAMNRKAENGGDPKDPRSAPLDPGALEIIAEYADDVFYGARERRVMAPDMEVAAMEVAASKQALAAAGVSASEVDLLILSSWMPDLLGTNNACTIHAELGMPTSSLSFSIDSNFNAFHHQVSLAAAQMMTGQARYALLVQSSSPSRLLTYQEPYSPWFGDAATAVVMGPVAGGHGLLGSAHRADGTLQGGLLAGVVGGRWFDEGRTKLYSAWPERQRAVFGSVCRVSSETIHAALGQANLEPGDVDFYASHQGIAWFRRVTQFSAGLTQARAVDSFAETGSIGACNVPMLLFQGQEQGRLSPGDVVATHGGGNGSTWSSLVMRWGTGRE